MTSWTAAEINVVTEAVRRAPSVGHIQPWSLRFRDGGISLHERAEPALTRRDRLVSCGGALTNLLLAMWVLGWDTHTRHFPDPAQLAELARVTATDRRPPSTRDRALHAAIRGRREFPGPRTAITVSDGVRQQLMIAPMAGGVDFHPVSGIDHREFLVLVHTAGDGPLDHLMAGRAIQDTWLAATCAGLAGSVLTGRPRTDARQDLPGIPQALLRFGYPADVAPGSSRMPLVEWPEFPGAR